jgi:hypothetical protein
VDQRVVALRADHDDVAAAAAVAARGAAAGNELLPPEGHAAVAAVAGLDANFCFIDEHTCIRNLCLASPSSCAMKPQAQKPAQLHPGMELTASVILLPASTRLRPETRNWARAGWTRSFVAGGHEARVQAAMKFEQLPPPSSLFAASSQTKTPGNEEPGKMQRPVPQTSPSAMARAVWAGNQISTGPTPVLDALLATEPLMAFDVVGRAPRDSSKPEATPSRPKIASQPTADANLNKPGKPSFAPVDKTLARLEPLIPAPSAVGLGTANWALASNTGAAMATAATRAALAAAAQIAQAQYARALASSQEGGPTAPADTAVVSAAELQALPVSGRNWQDFVLDNAPTSATPAGGQGEISLRGAGQSQTGITVDGASRELAFGSTNESGRGLQRQGGEPAGIAQVGAGGHGFAVSEAAIRTVETASGNMEASAGRAAGGRMNLETQRGGDKLHGQGSLFDRQNTWGAKNPSAQLVEEIAPANAALNSVPLFASQTYTPVEHEIVWGIGAGGRIRRDKLFWFAAVDGNDRNNPAVATVKHPCLEYDSNGVCTSGFFANPTNLDWQAPSVIAFTLEGIGARWNSPGGGLDPRLGNLRQPQLRISEGQRGVAAGPLGGIPDPQPAGRDSRPRRDAPS